MINGLLSPFCFVFIPLLWVYGNCKYLTIKVRESTFNVIFLPILLIAKADVINDSNYISNISHRS